MKTLWVSLSKGSDWTFKDINTVAEWQNYGSGMRGLATKLLNVLPRLPKLKVYTGSVFRVIAVNRAQLSKLVKTGKLPARKAESWSKLRNIVFEYIRFNGQLIDTDGDAVALIVFKSEATKKNSKLDLEALWKNEAWVKTVEAYEDSGKFFDEGLEFRGTQKEVVLSNEFLLLDEVDTVILGGKKLVGKDAVSALKNLIAKGAKL